MYEKPFVDMMVKSIGDRYGKKSPMIVAIAGRACSGKSTLAGQLITSIGSTALYLAFDDFFRSFDEHLMDKAGAERYFRFDDLEKVIRQLYTGETARYRRYDWHNGSYSSDIDIRAPLVIIEGLYVLRPELIPYYDFTIWVEGCVPNRLDRIVKRDGKAFLDRWISEWIPDEDTYLKTDQPWKEVDLVVAGADMVVSDLNRQLRG